MLKVAVTGCAGRMGREIAELVAANPAMRLACGVERRGHPLIGKEIAQVLMGIQDHHDKFLFPHVSSELKEVISEIDVVIDFTSPEASIENFQIVADAGKSIVIGSTGFSDDQIRTMESMRGKVRCVRSPNMSVGVNVMFKLLAEATRLLSANDIEIIETHHKLKKDAPSGTAMRLAEICAKETGRDLSKVAVYGRHGMIGERKPDEIAVMSLRLGDVVGEHTVTFGGHGERLEITHKATSRKNFAAGAVLAASWLVKQKNGIYDMQDVLEL